MVGMAESLAAMMEHSAAAIRDPESTSTDCLSPPTTASTLSNAASSLIPASSSPRGPSRAGVDARPTASTVVSLKN
uniref:Uncharacterized protein n=1 Tax=Trichuris muris TaxID=70415 RepID=A0A5S6QYQ0_TRIMR